MSPINGALGDDLDSVPFAASRAGMPRGVERVGRNRTGSCGQDLAGDELGIPALDVDCPSVPMVDDGGVGADLFVSAGPRGDSPGETWVMEDPPGSQSAVQDPGQNFGEVPAGDVEGTRPRQGCGECGPGRAAGRERRVSSPLAGSSRKISKKACLA